jgi:hypothetical protein
MTIDGVWIGELDLLTTCIHKSELRLTVHRYTHRLVPSVYYSLH